jgi:hypothetical protein
VTEQGNDDQACGEADERSDAQSDGKCLGSLDKALGGWMQDNLERDNCHQRSDRIDENAFSLQNSRQARFESQAAKQRRHDGRPRDDDERSEEHRQSPRPAEQEARADGASRSGDERSDRDELSDASGRAPQAPDLQIHSAFEQHDRDGVPDENLESWPEAVGLHDPEKIGTEQHAGSEKKHDAGYAHMSRQRLREHAGGERSRDRESGIREDYRRRGLHHWILTGGSAESRTCRPIRAR